MQSQKVKEWETASKPQDPARSGWNFSNWYSDYGLTEAYNFLTPITANLTLYASWVDLSKQKYTVTFNFNMGIEAEFQSIYDGERVVKINNPTRTGYNFDNWYTDNTTFLNQYNFSSPVTQNIQLYANWFPIYTVSFNKNNSSEGGTEANPQSKTVVHPASAVGNLPEPPSRKTYIFKGWNTQADGNGTVFTETTTVASNITVVTHR